MRNSHPFGMAHREGFVHRVADEPLQDRFQFLFEQIPNRRFGLDAAWVNVTAGFDRDFGPLIPVRSRSIPQASSG
jgi:hypothetical protein